MTNKLQLTLDRLTANPKKLFLTDCLGAMLTAFFLFVILAEFEENFGMPRKVLYVLSAIACVYSIYSFCCYLFTGNNWRPFLRIIGLANLLYCIATLVLLIIYYDRLTILGLAYFIIEIIIISVLVFIELRTVTVQKRSLR